MTIELYGIPNCDTVKKARKWLDLHGLDHVFHDYKKEGIDPERLAGWCDAQSWDVLLNRRGTTFRALSDANKQGIDRAKALTLMAAHTSLIKRPVVEHPGGLLVGFDAPAWEAALC